MKRFSQVMMVAAAGALCTACVVDVDVDEEVESRIRLEVDLQGECEGAGEIKADNGTSTYAKTLEDGGETCRIDLTWDGVLVDMESLRKDIEEQAKIDDVSVTSMEMRIETAALRDANGNRVTPPFVPFWSLFLEAAKSTLADFERTDISKLAGETIELEIEEALVDKANSALKDSKPLRAKARSTLRIATADLDPLQTAPGPVGVQVDLVTVVFATVETRPLRQ